MGSNAPSEASDRLGIGARGSLVTLMPGHVLWCAAVAHEQVLVEVGHAAADDRGEDVLGVECVGERASEASAEETRADASSSVRSSRWGA